MKPGYAHYYCLLLPSLATFLYMDFISRLATLFDGLSNVELFSNFGLVLFLGLLVLHGPAALLWLLSRKSPEPGRFLAFYLFYSVNLLFALYRMLKVEQVKNDTLYGIGLALLGLILYAALRSRLKELDEVSPRVFNGTLKAVHLLGAAVFVAAAVVSKDPVIEPGPADKPNIILVTFDGMAATHMSLYGYERATTPNLDRFAQENEWFTQARSASNFTTMTLPRVQGYYTYPQGAPLTTALQQAGWARPAYISAWRSGNLNIPALESLTPVREFEKNPLYGLFRRLFSANACLWLADLGTEEASAYNPFLVRQKSEIFWKKEHFDSELTFRRGLEYLKQRRRGAVLWIHSWAPHPPYVPPKAFQVFGPGELRDSNPMLINREYDADEQVRVDGLRNLFDGYMLYADHCFGDFIEGLKQNGLYDDSIIVVAADHGSSLNNGFVGHTGPYLWDELTRIPLFFKLPGLKSRKIDSLASLVDIAPTLLDYLSLPVPSSMHGESLLPLLKGEKDRSLTPKFAFSVNSLSGTGESAVFWDHYRLVWKTDQEYRLYNIDTGKRLDQPGQESDLEKKMKSMARFRPQDFFETAPAGH